MKTPELTGAALDWAVAKCEGAINGDDLDIGFILEGGYSPSTDWAQGGPIIERTGMDLKNKFEPEGRVCMAHMRVLGAKWVTGPTPLIAAMRAFVGVRLGDEVEIPKELT